MIQVYFSLGSNEGDRRANLEEALARMDAVFGTKGKKVSQIVESKADGFDGADFLNLAVRYETTLLPSEVLEAVKRIETSMGRHQTGAVYDEAGKRVYRDRPIDIDILLYGNGQMDTPELQIPHPRMQERDFVMVPLLQILNK